MQFLSFFKNRYMSHWNYNQTPPLDQVQQIDYAATGVQFLQKRINALQQIINGLSSGGLTIGSPITGGTNNRALYQSSGNLAQSANFTFDGTTLTASNLTITDGGVLGIGTGNGTIIGSASSKIGFFGATAPIQPTGNIVNALGALGLVKFPTMPESQLTFTDITTNNSTILLHGFLPKLSGTSTQYLGGDGNWTIPAGNTYSTDGITLQTSGTTFSIKLSTANTWTPASGTTFNIQALAATPSPAVILNNTTPAINGTNQVSPGSQWLGTTFGSSSNVTGFRAYSSGITAGRSTFYPVFNIDSTVDGTNFINVLKLYSVASAQVATLATGLTLAGPLTATNVNGNIIANGLLVNGATPAVLGTGITLPISTQITTYAILATDCTILADTTSGSFTVTLPAATTNSGQIFNIKKIAAASTLTIATSGGNIDGSATLSVTTNNQNTQVQSNGTNYYIL